MRHATIVVLAASLLAACGAEEPPPPAPAEQGRAETRGIRNTEAVGYSGEAIADRTDAALDAAEERERKLREAAAGAGVEESPQR